jgi:plastocyanin
MHRKPTSAFATLVMSAVLVPVATAGFLSHANTGRTANSERTPMKVVTVEIRGFKFEPATVTIQAGETLEWKNGNIVSHTATADEGAQKPTFDSGTIQTGAAWRYIAQKKARITTFVHSTRT